MFAHRLKRILIFLVIFVVADLFFTYVVENNDQGGSVANDNCSQEHELKSERISHFYGRKSWWDDMLCKDTKSNSIQTNISDLLPLNYFHRDEWTQKISSQNIFFMENNCKLTVPFYVQCAVESTAALNPNAIVFLLTAIPILDDRLNTIKNLLSHLPNIQIVQVDYDSVLQNTPLESFRSTTRWSTNKDFVKPHLSDALRVAILWKEGGVYMDTDTISLKPIPSEDIVMALSKNGLHTCFMKATRNHDFLLEIMNIQNASYDGSWVSMSQAPITKGVSVYCNDTLTKPGTYKDILLLPIDAFNPIDWDKTDELFKAPPTSNLSEIFKNSYAVHTSHYMAKDKLNELGKDNLYDRITKEYCPYSYNQNQ